MNNSKKILVFIISALAVGVIFGVAGGLFYSSTHKEQKPEPETTPEVTATTKTATPTATVTPTSTQTVKATATPTTKPITYGPITTGAKAYNKADLEALQKLVDNGLESWRKNPLQTAVSDGVSFGFYAADTYQLLFKEFNTKDGTYKASVRATHGKKTYLIHLSQPIKIGTDGLWVIDEVQVEK